MSQYTIEELDQIEAYDQIEWSVAGTKYQRSFYRMGKYQLIQNTRVPYARNWMDNISDWWWLDYQIEDTHANQQILAKYNGKVFDMGYAEDGTGVGSFDRAEDMIRYINEQLDKQQ